MAKIRKFLGCIVKIEQRVCCALLVLMLIICFGAVIMRYVFNRPLVWSEEVILTFLIWFGFMCISIGIFNDSHIAIEGVYNMFSSAGRKVLDIIRHILLLVFGCLMVYFGWKVFQINLLKRLPATHWPQALQYFPIVFCGGLIFIFSAANLIECITGKHNTDEGGEES